MTNGHQLKEQLRHKKYMHLEGFVPYSEVEEAARAWQTEIVAAQKRIGKKRPHKPNLGYLIRQV